MRGTVGRIAASLAVLLVMASIAEACPSCKEALASGGGQANNLVRGYFWSILFMMSMPFVILGSLSLYMYTLVRRARRQLPSQPLVAPGRFSSSPSA